MTAIHTSATAMSPMTNTRNQVVGTPRDDETASGEGGNTGVGEAFSVAGSTIAVGGGAGIWVAVAAMERAVGDGASFEGEAGAAGVAAVGCVNATVGVADARCDGVTDPADVGVALEGTDVGVGGSVSVAVGVSI